MGLLGRGFLQWFPLHACLVLFWCLDGFPTTHPQRHCTCVGDADAACVHTTRGKACPASVTPPKSCSLTLSCLHSRPPHSPECSLHAHGGRWRQQRASGTCPQTASTGLCSWASRPAHFTTVLTCSRRPRRSPSSAGARTVSLKSSFVFSRLAWVRSSLGQQACLCVVLYFEW